LVTNVTKKYGKLLIYKVVLFYCREAGRVMVSHIIPLIIFPFPFLIKISERVELVEVKK
jgi:hypothetical protein